MSGDAIEFQTRKNISVSLRRYTVDIDTTGALLLRSYFFFAFRATREHRGWDHAD